MLRFLTLRSLVGRLEQQVHKVQQELTAQMALLDHKDLLELPAQLEPLVLQVQTEQMVLQQQLQSAR